MGKTKKLTIQSKQLLNLFIEQKYYMICLFACLSGSSFSTILHGGKISCFIIGNEMLVLVRLVVSSYAFVSLC